MVVLWRGKLTDVSWGNTSINFGGVTSFLPPVSLKLSTVGAVIVKTNVIYRVCLAY